MCLQQSKSDPISSQKVIHPETKIRIHEASDGGLKKAALIESALLHHFQALEELPLDIIIPPRLVVSRKSGERMLELVAKSPEPTEAMKALFCTSVDDGQD